MACHRTTSRERKSGIPRRVTHFCPICEKKLTLNAGESKKYLIKGTRPCCSRVCGRAYSRWMKQGSEYVTTDIQKRVKLWARKRPVGTKFEIGTIAKDLNVQSRSMSKHLLRVPDVIQRTEERTKTHAYFWEVIAHAA